MTKEGLVYVRRVAGSIRPLDPAYLEEAQRHLNGLTKPVGSLGRLESVAAQMVAIDRGAVKLPLRKAAYVFAADHGVAQAGVSAYPPEVTAQMVANFLRGGAAINVLTRQHGAELTVVDVGVNADLDDAAGLHRAKVRKSSRNFLEEPAMTEREMEDAMQLGISIAQEAKASGVQLAAVGEMGIGNTTAASAITVLLTERAAEDVTGRGTGLDDAGRTRKVDAIVRAVRTHFPDGPSDDPLEILRCVGGLELAAMAGFFLGAAQSGLAVICDGFISTAAAAIAYALAPAMRDYLIAGHSSEEPGHRYLLETIGIAPLLQLNMRLGEGTGAVLAMPIVESAMRLYSEMATFASAGVSGASA